MRIQLFLTSVALAICSSGCQREPESEVLAARSAILDARKSGAEKSAAAQLSQSSNLLDSALREIEKQKKAMVGRDFSAAKQLLREAGEAAQIAGMHALKDSGFSKTVGKDGVLKAVVAPISEKEKVELVMNRASELYRDVFARTGSGGAAGNDLKYLKEDLEEAKTARSAGNLGLALRIATRTVNRLSEMNAKASQKSAQSANPNSENKDAREYASRREPEATGGGRGEPSEAEMLKSLKAMLNGFNEANRERMAACNSGQAKDNPILTFQCLAQMGAGGGNGDWGYDISHFEKIGRCSPAQGQPGYVCDYSMRINSDNRLMNSAMQSFTGGGAHGQGRFVLNRGQWIFFKVEP